MPIVKFYRGDLANTPKTTMGAHLGSNAILTWNGKILLEKRRDSDVWGLIGGASLVPEKFVKIIEAANQPTV